MNDLALFLSTSPFFQGTDDLVLEYALELGKVRQIHPDELLIKKDEPNFSLFIILKGKVGIRLDRRRTFVELEALDCVGEMSMVDGSLSSADVLVLEAGQVFELPRDATWNLVNRSHAVACNLLKILTKRLRMGNTVVVEEARKAESFAVEAQTDTLTGVFNRRWMLGNFARVIHRQVQEGRECCFLFFDIDHFKRINDTMGHQIGDDVLRRVAAVALQVCRPADLIVRYAGDEFALLLPQTYIDQGLVVAKRLVAAISGNQELQQLTAPEKITVSIGVASTRENKDLETLLEAADLAMYRAKDFGRNRASV